jgi:mannose-6-phosphate isomerase-like protein (cupin superfamily)
MAAVYAEVRDKVPALLPLADPSRGPGMHATSTIDFIVVVSGRVTLVLENGEADLAAGDAVVQLGAWHTWRNPWDEPCVLTGAALAAGR